MRSHFVRRSDVSERTTLTESAEFIITRFEMHQPGIEPGSVPWQGTILPLDHWCLLDGFPHFYYQFYKHVSFPNFTTNPSSRRKSVTERTKQGAPGRAEKELKRENDDSHFQGINSTLQSTVPLPASGSMDFSCKWNLQEEEAAAA
ncbi:unnamed protein product [Linum trigynum]|uniref:Uncharacterized protein n=1 Tax=Linum trigynum TaxID=586398 RepID=A0AAV2D6B7_9ROSI